LSSHLYDPTARSVGSPACASTLRIALLGPVEVSTAGDDVTLSPLELNLLVLLAVTPGVAVSTERLIDQLWGSDLPVAPRSRVQGLVSGLRRKVGDAVKTRYPGYLIDPVRLERDIDECDRLVVAARETSSPRERAGLLTAALEVWRGEPLVGISTAGVAPERARLVELRLSLLEARSEAELALGNHRSLTSVLAPAVAENPFREQLAGLYITALYRSNRQADALAVYHELRERLADELGSDVCAQLRELYAQILRGEGLPTGIAPVDPAVSADVVEAPVELADEGPTPHVGVRPAQLPASDGLFVGRAGDLQALEEAVGQGRRGTTSAGGGADTRAVVVVSGPGGLGKTALVVEWAHRASTDFPDGQLFVDLGGADDAPDEAVGAALLALGVASVDLPPAVADRIGLYRTLVRDRRLLVVADDAGSVEQVLALVPPGPESRLVVTTRRRLVSLATHHAVREIVLDPLDAGVTTELLQRLVGAERLAVPATASLVEWCGGWPLLVRHAGATLVFRPSQPINTFVRELEGAAGDVVLQEDQRSVDAALASVHALLSPAAARLFERLALHSGVICLHLAAVAAGTSTHRVRALLDELVAVHLLVESRTGEFGLYDVVARFGRRLACEAEWTTPTWGDADAVTAGCLECCDSPAVTTARTLDVVIPARTPVSV
jgi:DNA-binding SARP family transcriptional activator